MFAALALLGQTIVGAIDPMIVFADEIAHPQTVTVELDLAHQYVVEGTFSDGRQCQKSLFHIMLCTTA